MDEEIKNEIRKLKTMHDRYGDGSDHIVCEKCGLCITCGDCQCKL
ncbi:unnamed protein product [marine sediment metagenome]|uniref:Uncharacterized protein n=1 Tax=marine sediment metagenome TaxID=412755 RepID=X1P8D8_9ZZZZ